MKELIIGLLGGGTLVQLINLLLNARSSRRQQQAQALDTEISAREHTIKILSESIDIETRRHSLERQELREEIVALKRQIATLIENVETLKTENLRLSSSLGMADFDSELLNTPSLQS